MLSLYGGGGGHQRRHRLTPEVKVGRCCCARLQGVDGHVECVEQCQNGRARPWKQYGHVPRYRRHGTTCKVETECLNPWMSQMAPEITSISRVSTGMYIAALKTIREQLKMLRCKSECDKQKIKNKNLCAQDRAARTMERSWYQRRHRYPIASCMFIFA